MMNTIQKSLTVAFLTISVFISGVSGDLVSAQTSTPEPVVTLTPEERDWLAEHPKIVLGASTSYPPFVIKKNDGTHIGVLVDYLEAVSRLLNHRIRLHIEDPWTKVQERAANREIDGLAMGGRTHKRKALYNATEPILKTYDAVYSRNKDEYQIKEFSDLDGMRIGYRKGSKAALSVLEKLPNATLIPYVRNEDLTQALLSKDVEVVVAWVNYGHWLKENMLGTINNIYIIEEHPQKYFTHIRKDWPELVSILNKTIITMQQDALPRIMNKWFLGWPVRTKAPSVQLTPEERAWLIKHPIIRTRFHEHPPYMYHRDGETSGIVADVLNVISKMVDITFEIEKKPSKWSDDLERLIKHENLDLLPSIMATPDREKHILFTKPYTNSPRFIFTREDVPVISSIENLRDKKIAVVEGYAVHRELVEKYPNLDLLVLDDIEDVIRAVSLGKAFALIGDLISTPVMITEFGLKNLKAACPSGLSDHPLGMGIRNDWPELRDILDKTIKAIPPNDLVAIKNKWAPFSVEYEISSGDVIKLTDEEQDWLKAHQVVTIAYPGDYGPYSFQDQHGEFKGISVDLVNEVARRAGLKLKTYPDGNWTNLYSAAQQHEVDVIGGIIKRPERDRWFEFTKPYLATAQYIVTRREQTDIQQRNDIDSKTLALVRGYATTKTLLEEFPNVKPYYVDSVEAAFEAVSLGKADASLGVMGAVQHFVAVKGIQNLRLAALFSEEITDWRIGVRKDWPLLRSILDKSLASISDEERQQIFLRWTTIDVAQAEAVVSARTALSFTSAEQAWITKNDTVRVRIMDYPPYQIIKGNETPQGITIEYLKLIEERTGIEFKYEVSDQPFAEFLENMKQGKGPDMTAIIMQTPDREQYLSFTAPYLSSPYVIFIREEDNPIFDIQGLLGKTLAVPRGLVAQEQLSRDYPDIRLSLFDSDEKALQAVATGQADAYIGSLTAASHIIHNMGLAHLKVAAPGPFKEQNLSMGIRSDWPELRSIITRRWRVSQKKRKLLCVTSTSR